MCNTCGGHAAHAHPPWGTILIVAGVALAAAGAVVVARERNRTRA